MKITFNSGILVLFIAIASCMETGIYVSPDGDDNNPGTKKMPFKTIRQAQQSVREILAEGQTGNITVYLDGGDYRITEPLVFGKEDSGQGDYSITYRAVDGTLPVISGGMEITGWERTKDGYWVTGVEPDEIENNIFRELFIDGRRATRARHPDNGYLRVEKAGEDRRTNFMFREGDFPFPEKHEQTEVVLLHDWSVSRVPVADIDTDLLRITVVDSLGAKKLAFFNIDNWEKHPRYFLENSRVFLSAPYEWFFDTVEGLLYLVMPDGQDPNDSRIIVPATGPHLIQISGNKDNRVKNIHFIGITFNYCSWLLPEKGYAGIQACYHDPRPAGDRWAAVPSSIELRWAENCSFTDCHLKHLGGSGLRIGMGCTGCSVIDSWFGDISGNGIMIGDGSRSQVNEKPWWETHPEQLAENNLISGNTIRAAGKQFYGATGIWAGVTAGTIIRENHLYNLPYTGISSGWEWSPVPTPAKYNQITGNHIHNIMEILSDGGGIYLLGLQPGTVIAGNLIHDIGKEAGRAPSNGIFIDEGSSGITISGNIIYNISSSAIRFHRASTDILINDNILSRSEGVPAFWYGNTPEENIKLENNRLLIDSDPEHQELVRNAISNLLTDFPVIFLE